MNVIISDHALIGANRRGISVDTVMFVAEAPQQIVEAKQGRKICQSILPDSLSGQMMLFRVIIKEHNDVRHVVTVYRTSKIEKYWLEDDQQ